MSAKAPHEIGHAQARRVRSAADEGCYGGAALSYTALARLYVWRVLSAAFWVSALT